MGVAANLNCFEIGEQGTAPIPRGVRALCGDIVAVQRRNGYRRDGLETELFGKCAIFSLYLIKSGLRKPNKIHLVNSQYNVPDAQERTDIAVTPRLGEDALARVNQNDRKIGG